MGRDWKRKLKLSILGSERVKIIDELTPAVLGKLGLVQIITSLCGDVKGLLSLFKYLCFIKSNLGDGKEATVLLRKKKN